MATVADALVDAFARAGVTTVFGVVGTSTLDVADAIARHGTVDFVSARSEEAAAHMADGYARATGRVGVVLCHVGPGALRQLYGVGTAWKDSVPLVALTGNEVPRMTDTAMREGYHVVDVRALYRPVTKATLRLDDAADPYVVAARALWLATAGRPGPVLVDLPKSALKQECAAAPDPPMPAAQVPASRPRPGRAELTALADALAGASCPVVYAGGGVHWSAASDALVALAERANLPVLTTDGGRGAVPEDHPLALGVIARQAGDAVARQLLADADVVLAIGTPLSDVSTFEWTGWSPQCRVFQVDVAAEPLRKGVFTTTPVVADARACCVDLTDALRSRCPQDWRARREQLEVERAGYLDGAGEGDLVDPWHVLRALRDRLPRGSFVSVDSGMHSYFGKKLPVHASGTYIRSAGFGAMGYSFPALLGAVEGVPDRRGVAVVGDGCLAMCLGEFETAARRKSPVTVVVFNDGAYASQRSHQRRRFDGRLTGTSFLPTDFAKIADAHGVTGWTVVAPADVDEVIAAALGAEGPNVVDVHVDPDVTPATWVEGSGDARVAGAG